MINRSEEIIKQLNRLVNDRSLPPYARNRVSHAIQHIKELNRQFVQSQDEDTDLTDVEF